MAAENCFNMNFNVFLQIHTVKNPVLIRHACVLIESTRIAAHESYRSACRINTGFFTVQLLQKNNFVSGFYETSWAQL
jgi:hypothetical protein